jgi:pimeloyl-ACP methyl ester carboxylesterase
MGIELPTTFVNGLRVCDAGPRQQNAVLLLHGLGNSLDYWAAVVPGLAEEHRTIALDIPGFGQSPPPTGSYTAEHLADVIWRVVEALGVTTICVVGHSLGAVVSMELSVRQPRSVSHLVLVDGALFRVSQLLQHPSYAAKEPGLVVDVSAQFVGALIPMDGFVRKLFYRRLIRVALLWPFVADPSHLPPDLLDRVLKDNRGGGTALRVLNVARSLDLSALASAVSCGVSLVRGEDDRLVNDADTRRATDLLHVTSSTVIPDCGHWPMVERPSELISVLRTVANTLT